MTNTPCFVKKQTLNSGFLGTILWGDGCLLTTGGSKQLQELVLNLELEDPALSFVDGDRLIVVV